MNSTDANQIGIIIVGHGQYGAALLKAAENIMGPQEDCVAISVDIAQDVSEVVRRLTDAAQRLDYGQGVIVLTDMFGGTPTNLALSLLGQHKTEVVTGVNLPMLLKVIEARANMELDPLASHIGDAGKNGIVVAGQMLKQLGREKN